MAQRRSEFDVTNSVNTTDPLAVRGEIGQIYLGLYPNGSTSALTRAFADCTRLHQGRYPGYWGCDTAYHNLQHTLDVTLAMARLMDGYERSSQRAEPLGARLFNFGIIAALFHDIGYLRHRHDTRRQNGAEYTLRHVSRGGRFLEDYMRELGMADLAQLASRVLHFTGYEVPVSQIDVPNATFRRLGHMLGSADILAQMADRCYLEKCHDRLYPEFVAGGLAQPMAGRGAATARFTSAEDLVRETPRFYEVASGRLKDVLGAVYAYASDHFGGQNLYLDEVDKNIRHAQRIARAPEVRAFLRRVPPASPPQPQLAAA
jgi:hypothetical protein